MSTESHELITRAGMRSTPQRVVVLSALRRETGDITAQVLHARLRAEHPTIGLATVYRALGSLADAGVIDTLHHGSSVCFRYCSPGHHHHLTCTACHAVVELRDCEIGVWAGKIAADHGFTDVRHSLELSGLCPECARDNESSRP